MTPTCMTTITPIFVCSEVDVDLCHLGQSSRARYGEVRRGMARSVGLEEERCGEKRLVGAGGTFELGAAGRAGDETRLGVTSREMARNDEKRLVGTWSGRERLVEE